MASYQDIDVRLQGVENALMFLMSSIKVKQSVGSQFDVAPLIREISMLDYYKEQLLGGLLETQKVTTDGTDSAASDSTPAAE